MKGISVILLTIASVLIMFAACVSNQAPAPAVGKPLVTRLPAGVEGVELVGSTVRLKPGYDFVKQTDGTITVARIGGGGGALGVGGKWKCACDGKKGECGAVTTGGSLGCTTGTCNGNCDLIVTTTPGRLGTGIIAY